MMMTIMRVLLILATLGGKAVVAKMPGLDPWEVEGEGEAECQDLSTCPRFYNNTEPDYDPNDPSGLVVDDELHAFMASTMTEFLGMVAEKYPPDRALDSPDVFNGISGRALMYLRLFDRSKDSEYLATAKAYADTALAHVAELGYTSCGFNWGSTGVYSVAAAIYDRLGTITDLTDDDGAAASAYVAQLVDVVKGLFARSVDDAACPYDDWDSGRAGLLFSATFLQRNLPNYLSRQEPTVLQQPSSRKTNGEEEVEEADSFVIERSLVVAVACAVVDRGVAVSRNKTYLEWVSPNDGEIWLGQSHGSAGVLHGLLQVQEVSVGNATARGLIVATLDHIVASQQPSGNFPTEYYSPDEDALVQWDHGAPGVMAVLAQAALLYANVTTQTSSSPKGEPVCNGSLWVESALEAAECTWQRGLLVKGLMLCHGISGNTYMQLHLASLLSSLAQVQPSLLPVDQDPQEIVNKLIWRALKFQHFVMNTTALHDPQEMRKPTPSPYYFYTASYESGATAWADLLRNSIDPIQATMPAY